MSLFSLNNLFLVSKSFCDSPEPWQMTFQEAATPTMEGIINLHNDIMAIIVFIVIFTCWMLARTLYLFSSSRNKVPSKQVHGTVIELIWTIIPSFILITISVPSFALLYSMDEVIDPAITLKVVGHQWYWSYEYSDYNTSDDEMINFDSYMIAEDDLELGQLRLLEVDNRVVLPINTHIRVLITSTDVIHAWAIPSLGIKCDAYPGRLNQVNTFIKREGIFHGQCSELCGVNHGFMPIVVEAVTLQDYVSWISTKLEDA
jgi:cytochrome c oxidase subunit 2